MIKLPSTDKLAAKDGLVGLEHHSILQGRVLVDVEPGAVRAYLAVVAIEQGPVQHVLIKLIWTQTDVALDLAEQLVRDFDIALRGPTYEDVALVLFELLEVEVVDLTVVWTAKHLESQGRERLALLISSQRVEVNYDVCFSYIYEHIILQDSFSKLHLLENAEANS